MRLALAAALGCAVVFAGCTDARDRFATHEARHEARLDGEVELHVGWWDADTLVVASPVRASSEREAFEQTQLLAQLEGRSEAGLPLRAVAVGWWHFEGGAVTLAPPGREVRLVAATRSGKAESLPPSKLLDPISDPARKARLMARLGAAGWPTLEKGQSLQLWFVLPTAASPEELDSFRLVVGEPGERELALDHRRATARGWDEFRTRPSRARFDAAIGVVAVPTATQEAPIHDTTDPGR